MNVRIALLQVASPDGELAPARIDRVCAMAESIDSPVDLIALPELWSVGYNHFGDYSSGAECLDGATIRSMRAIARWHNCHVHIGTFIQKLEGTRLRNTSVLIGPDGAIIHRYSKVHIFGYESSESNLIEGGCSVSVAHTSFGKIGSAICYDLRFPALWSVLGTDGPEIMVVPAAWPMSRLDHWRLLTQARAVDNQVFVVACNAVGTHGGVELAGHSRVVDPWGRVLAESDAAPGVTLVDISIDAVAQARQTFPLLSDRLADYQHLANAADGD